MPVIGADQDLQLELQDSFSGGQRDRDHPSKLLPNQFYYMKNGEIRDSGLCKLRRGSYTRCASLSKTPARGAFFWEPTAGNGIIVAAIQEKLYWWANSGNAWTVLPITGLSQLVNATTRCAFTVNRLSDVKNMIGHLGYDDDCISWTGDTAVNAVRFGTTHTSTDIRRSNLACIQADRDCIAGIGDYPDHVLFSGIRAVEDGQWSLANFAIKATTDANEKITAIAAYLQDSIIAMTRNSTQIISGLRLAADDAGGNQFTRYTADNHFGTEAPDSLQVFGKEAYAMSADRHVRTFRRSEFDANYGVENFPLSYFNVNLIDRINKANAYKAQAVVFDNYYLLAVPMDSSTYNNAVLAFDLLHQNDAPFGTAPAMVGEWTGWNVGSWVVANFSGRQRLFFVDNQNGKLIEALVGDTDDVDYPSFELQTRGYTWGNPRLDKTVHHGEFKYETTSGNLTIAAAGDDRVFSTVKSVSIGSNAPGLPVNLPFNFGSPADDHDYFYMGEYFGRNRTWRLKFTHSAGPINLREISLAAFMEPMSIRR